MQVLKENLVPFLIAIICGVFLGGVWSATYMFALFFFLFGMVALCFKLFTKNTQALFIFICCLGIALGVMRFTEWNNIPTDQRLDGVVGQQVFLTGVIDDEPDVREGKTHLTISLRGVNTDEHNTPVFGKLIASVERYPEYQYGDVLELKGKLQLPKVITEDDGRTFDYPTYLRSKGIRYQMSFAKIHRVSTGEGNILVASLLKMKQKLLHATESALPSPHSALVNGLLLGGKQSLGTEWTERFRVTGIVHIVVLSGYNMTVVAVWLVALFSFLGFLGSLSVGAVGIVLFAIMAGAGATVVRALIMALLVLFARATGRTSEMGRALLLAGALMVLQNPSILLYDPSFQLSFLASLGLVFVSPAICEWKFIVRVKRWSTTHEILVSTLATQIAVLPLLLKQTGMLSVVALPVNMLVLPLIPLTMLSGFIASVTTLFFPFVGTIIALPAYFFSSWIFAVAQHASALPFASVNVGTLSYGVMFGMYVLLAFWLYVAHQRISRVAQARAIHPLHSASDKISREQ